MNVTVGLAFLAGLASFLSPCVFSLVPAYIGYLSGRSIASREAQKKNAMPSLLHGLAFVLGFTVVFVILGVAVSALGGVLFAVRGWITKIGGVIVILFGLHMTGLIRIPFLDYDLRPQTTIDQSRGYLSSFLMGIFFSAGWSPCVGPVLGAILTLAFNGGSITEGVMLLTAYSAGMAIPFLIAAVAIGWFTQILKKYKKGMSIIQKVMGGILIIVGVLLILGTFEQLARLGFFVDFGL